MSSRRGPPGFAAIRPEGIELAADLLMDTVVVVVDDQRLGMVAAVGLSELGSGDTTAFLEDNDLLVPHATAVGKNEPRFARIVASPEAAGPIMEIVAADTEETDTGWVDIAAFPAAVGL